MSESFAETNAYNITITNVSSGEIIYQKIIPKDSSFSDTIEIGGYTIILNYIADSGGSYFTGNSTVYNITWGKGGYTSFSDGIFDIEITPITYDFNSSSSSAKAPIPLGVYLAITAFFTYILYRKSKTLT